MPMSSQNRKHAGGREAWLVPTCFQLPVFSREEKVMKRLGLVALVVILPFVITSLVAADEKIDVKAFEKTVDRALKAYNDNDYKKFWDEFAKAADALKTKET